MRTREQAIEAVALLFALRRKCETRLARVRRVDSIERARREFAAADGAYREAAAERDAIVAREARS